jgi:ribonuclease BN (tRNA processing enzyme)
MEWIILGSGTLIPDRHRGSAAHLLVGEPGAALFDSGSGTKDRIALAGVAFERVSHLLYSHAHLDHWADLLSLLFYRANSPRDRRTAGQTVVGPPGFSAMVQQVARAASPSLIEDNADVRWIDLEVGTTLDAGWFRVCPYTMSHGGQNAVGYRVEGEQGSATWSVAYSGDCAPSDGLRALAAGVDCLVCECSLPESRRVDNHMTPQGVRALGEHAHPGRIVLTHLYPEVLEPGIIEEAFEGYAGQVVVGYDGLRIGLTPGA